MSKVVTIYDAKTNLSKYIKEAKAGHPVYIGSYGEREVILMAAPQDKPIRFGIAEGQFAYTDKVLEGVDEEIQQLFYGNTESK